MYINGGKVTKS